MANGRQHATEDRQSHERVQDGCQDAPLHTTSTLHAHPTLCPSAAVSVEDVGTVLADALEDRLKLEPAGELEADLAARLHRLIVADVPGFGSGPSRGGVRHQLRLRGAFKGQ